MSAGFPRITVRAEKQRKASPVQTAQGAAAAGILLCVNLLLTTSCATLQQAQSNHAAVSPVVVSATLPAAAMGTPYKAQVKASGGTPPYQYTLLNTLPPGVTLDANSGVIAGVPTSAGTYAFAVEVTDSTKQNHGSSQFSLPVTHPENQVSVSVTPANVTISAGASQQFAATVKNTGNSAVTWSASLGSISANGAFAAPAVSVNTNVTVTAASAADSSVKAVATVTVTPVVKSSPLVINTNGVPAVKVGADYNASLAASGGKTPYLWSAVSGSLPSGVQLDKAGVLYGNTTQAGQFSFGVKVTDASTPAQTAQTTLSLVVNPASHVKLNALFPPMGPGNSMWSEFNTYVLTNPYLDGVNPGLDWNTVETSQGVYDFSKFDASLKAFYDAGKTVNLIIRPVSNGGVNSLTPAYVFSSRWASSLGAAPLSLVTCSGYPGNGSRNSGFPVVYELPFKVAYKRFVAAALAHYAGNQHIGYIRVGLAVGGEAFPWCSDGMPGFSQATWLNYVEEMNGFERSLNPTMKLMAALNQVYENGSWDQSYSNTEASSAVANGQGIGSQGWQQADIANFKAGLPCTSDWCNLFDQYAGQVPLELQQEGQSVANGGTTTGSMADIIPFAVAHHVNILEIYVQDLMTAFDPKWPGYAEYGPSYRQAMVTAHGPK